MNTEVVFLGRILTTFRYLLHTTRLVLFSRFLATRRTKNVLVLEAANHRDSIELCKAARKRGFSVHIVTPTYKTRCIFFAASVLRVDPFERENWDDIVRYAKRIRARSVLIAHKEALLPLAKYVADDLGVRSYQTKTVETSTSKRAMRLEMERAGVATTRVFQTVGQIDRYPVVAKMSDESGSNGTRLIETAEQVGLARNADLFEEYVQGPQFDVECISFGSSHFATCIVHEYYEKRKPFFPPSWHLFNPPIDIEFRDHIFDFVHRMLSAMGVSDGASHTELRIDENSNIKVLEYANRIGSSFGPLVRISTGYDPFSAIVDSMTGSRPADPQRVEKTLVKAFILDDDDERLFNAVERVPSTHLISVKKRPGEITAGITFRGYYIALLDSPWRWYDMWNSFCGDGLDKILSHSYWNTRR